MLRSGSLTPDAATHFDLQTGVHSTLPGLVGDPVNGASYAAPFTDANALPSPYAYSPEWSLSAPLVVEAQQSGLGNIYALARPTA